MATEEKQSRPMGSWQKGWLAAIAAIIILFIVFIVGLAAGRFGRTGYYMDGYRTGGHMMGDHRFIGGGGMFGQDYQARVIGTVTSTNGSDFTVAGGGTTNTVKTDNSTQWEGGNSVKTNDTVVAYGSVSNGTFTATLVQINP